MSDELKCRRLLNDLESAGVNAVGLIPSNPEKQSISLLKTDNKIEVTEIENIQIESKEKWGDLPLEYKSSIWPLSEQIISAFYYKVADDLTAVFGISLKKQLTKGLKDKIRSSLKVSDGADIDYLIESFEKLKSDFDQIIKSERAAAITETAVTVNHEINNPLTAILGNTQLLLMSRDKLDEKIVNKLETIEQSAIRIRETTNKLMKIIDPVRTHYAAGLNMIDIDKSSSKED
jgi:signal transduction histidine kinase